MSTEIICQDGFLSRFAVTSRFNPIQRIITQPIYNIKNASVCQLFGQTFLIFLKNFFSAPFIALLDVFYTSIYACARVNIIILSTLDRKNVPRLGDVFIKIKKIVYVFIDESTHLFFVAGRVLIVYSYRFHPHRVGGCQRFGAIVHNNTIAKR